MTRESDLARGQTRVAFPTGKASGWMRWGDRTRGVDVMGDQTRERIKAVLLKPQP